MEQKIVTGKKNSVLTIDRFTGLDRESDLNPGGFYQTGGVTEERGRITALKKRLSFSFSDGEPEIECMIIPQGAISENYFTGIAKINDTYVFYFEDEPMGELTDAHHSIVDFSGKILIFPEKKYFSYLPELSSELSDMEKGFTGTFSFRSYASGLNTISSTGVDFSDYFEVGDSVTVTGTSLNDTAPPGESPSGFLAASVIVKDVSTDGKMEVVLYDENAEKTAFLSESSVTATVKKAIPDMRLVCVHNNRLWGVSTGNPGRKIYASRLGDPFSFSSFSGTKADSWWTEVASPGRFSGIYSFENSVMCFKCGCIHKVFGTNPQNFSVPYVFNGGTRDEKSIASVGGRLYFASQGGIMATVGGEPIKVGGVKITSGSAVGFDGKYYISSRDGLFVYSPDSGIWLCEGEGGSKLARSGEYMLSAKGGTLTSFNEFDEEDNGEYMMESCRILLSPYLSCGPFSVIFTVDIKGSAEFFINTGGGYKKVGDSEGEGLFNLKFPIREQKCDYFRYKITGSGEFRLIKLEVTV